MRIIDEEEVRPEAGSSPQDKNEAAEREQRIEAYKEEVRRRAYPNWTDLLAIVGIFLGASLVAGLLIAVSGLFSATNPAEEFVSGSTALNAIAYAVQFIIAITCVILLQRQRGVKKNFIKLNLRNFNPILVLWGMVLVVVSGIVIEPVLALFPSQYLDAIYKGVGTGGWAILMTVVFAPILEEVLFRGLVLEPVREKSGAMRAVLISAIMFGVIHIIPQQVVNAFVIGIILGYIYIKTDSLINVILIHALNNGVAYIQMELLGDNAATTTARSLIGNDTLYWIVYALFVVLFVVAFYGMMKSLNKGRQAGSVLPAEKTTARITHNDNNNR